MRKVIRNRALKPVSEITVPQVKCCEKEISKKIIILIGGKNCFFRIEIQCLPHFAMPHLHSTITQISPSS
jgi:hypothetical protein